MVESSPVDVMFRTPSAGAGASSPASSDASLRFEAQREGEEFDYTDIRERIRRHEENKDWHRNGGLVRPGELQRISFRRKWCAARELEKLELVGFVFKQSRHFREWRDRWAALTTKSLMFFEWPGNYQRVPRERVMLQDLRQIVINGCYITVATEERCIELCCDNPESATRWSRRIYELAPAAEFVRGEAPRDLP